MTNEIRLGGPLLGCSIDVLNGARLSSLRINGRERLVRATRDASSTSWGAYPMVPFAGRVRDGRFVHDGVEHQLVRNHGRHAIHGTVFDRSWTILERSDHHALLRVDLGSRWPFPGSVTHEVSIDQPTRTITCVLTVHTSGTSMPAQVGWHPWFARPVSVEVDFEEMYVRDEHHIPTGQRTAVQPPPWDDCFTGARHAPTLVFADGIRVEVVSDCDHFVIYDEPVHALCVEPQSGPPNAFSISPQVVTTTQPLRRTMKLIAR